MSRALAALIRVYTFVERVIVVILLIVLMIVVLWASGIYSFDLMHMLGQRIMGGERISGEAVTVVSTRMIVLRDVFGGFMLILIGVELMKTVAMYLLSHEMHVEVVFTVAMIGIARHAIDLDLAHLEGLQLIGLSTLLVALALGYYLFRKAAALNASESSPVESRRTGFTVAGPPGASPD
jgi:uncharacterized membrane protein (DUF373 family)